MTSSNGNIFRVTGHLCGEFIGPRWIPHTKAGDAELWCLLWSAPGWRLGKQSWGWWFETLSHSLWRHRNVYLLCSTEWEKFYHSHHKLCSNFFDSMIKLISYMAVIDVWGHAKYSKYITNKVMLRHCSCLLNVKIIVSYVLWYGKCGILS